MKLECERRKLESLGFRGLAGLQIAIHECSNCNFFVLQLLAKQLNVRGEIEIMRGGM